MKTYVITLSKNFLKGHPKAGEPTNFAHLLGNGLNITDDNLKFCKHKIHTIRGNYPFWKKRIQEVQRGNACLSIRQWSGKPYQSKQVEIARLTAKDGIGIQKLQWGKTDYWFIDDRQSNTANNFSLAQNDGLTHDDWIQWFKGYNIREEMAIIHFTKFRY